MPDHRYNRHPGQLVLAGDGPRLRMRDMPGAWDVVITHWLGWDTTHAARTVRHEYRYWRSIGMDPGTARAVLFGSLARCGYTLSPWKRTAVLADSSVFVPGAGVAA